MLSLVVSVFQLRRGLGMPSTVAELYEIAAMAMLERGANASAVPRLVELLQTIFFSAQVLAATNSPATRACKQPWLTPFFR